MEEWRCFLCSGRVMWENDFMFEDFGVEGEGVVHIYTCSKCGAEYVVYDAIEEEGSD